MFLGTGDAMFDPMNRRLGNGIVGVKIDANKQLQLADYFGAPNANWLWRRDLDVNVTPMAFDYRGRKFLVGSSKECRLWLLDREALGGDDHRTTLDTTPLVCNDAQAFDEQRRLGRAERVAGSVWRAVGADALLGTGEHRLQGADRIRPAEGRRRRGVQGARSRRASGSWCRPGCRATWIWRRKRSSPTASCSPTRPARTPARWCRTARGTRRAVRATAAASARARCAAFPGSRKAVLYALDGLTGKELWSSGTQIESWNHFSGLTVANGRAYIATFDGVLYCFGVAK